MNELRQRILATLTEPGCVRVLNQGALEEELWTEDEWQDEYAADLERELDAMESEGLLASVDTFGMKAYHLKGEPSDDH